MNDSPQTAPRTTIVIFAVVVLLIVGGAVLLLASQPAPVAITINPPQPTGTPEPSATPGPITVYVTGAVGQPESMIELSAGSRAQDAIEAAGGANDNADLERVNLAQVLRDGDQVHVPESGVDTDAEAPLPTPGDTRIPINSATIEELQTLPGIGPALAQRIFDHRETFGPFANLEALDEVSGIGPALLDGLRDLILFD